MYTVTNYTYKNILDIVEPLYNEPNNEFALESRLRNELQKSKFLYTHITLSCEMPEIANGKLGQE